MSYKKYRATRLFTGKNFLEDSPALITDEWGKIADILPIEQAGGDIQEFTGILCPGFVNCHCHLELSHMKGVIPEKTGLVDFVTSIMQLRDFSEEEILQAIVQEEERMWQNGIVAVGDICNTTHTLEQKKKHRLWYHNFIEVSGFVPQSASNRFQRSEEIYNSFIQNSSGLPFSSKTSIVPHAPYSVSHQLFELINNHSKGAIISVHNQESLAENDFYVTGVSDFEKLYKAIGVNLSFYTPYGNKSSLRTYFPWLDKPSAILLVHNTFSSEEDLAFALQLAAGRNQGLYWCLCPNANLYIENTMPPVDLLSQKTENIVLGTDSLASNHRLSILSEINTIRQYFPGISVEVLLKWATSNGAEALGAGDIFGSFAKGTEPGILVINEGLTSVKRLV